MCRVDHRDQGLRCEGKKPAGEYQTVFVNQKLPVMTAEYIARLSLQWDVDNHALTSLFIPESSPMLVSSTHLCGWIFLCRRMQLSRNIPHCSLCVAYPLKKGTWSGRTSAESSCPGRLKALFSGPAQVHAATSQHCLCAGVEGRRVRKLPFPGARVTVQTNMKIWESNLVPCPPRLLLVHQTAYRMDMIHLCPVDFPREGLCQLLEE